VELFKETFSTEIVEPSKLILEGKKKRKNNESEFQFKENKKFFYHACKSLLAQ
jgi:hypothetical protein